MISSSTQGLSRLASDMVRGAESAPKQARGAGAKMLDAAASDAQSRALVAWSTYGRGMRGSAGTIRARMSNSETAVGYLFGDGQGVFQSEHGSGHRAPQPVIAEAVHGQLDRFAGELSRVSIL